MVSKVAGDRSGNRAIPLLSAGDDLETGRLEEGSEPRLNVKALAEALRGEKNSISMRVREGRTNTHAGDDDVLQ